MQFVPIEHRRLERAWIAAVVRPETLPRDKVHQPVAIDVPGMDRVVVLGIIPTGQGKGSLRNPLIHAGFDAVDCQEIDPTARGS